MRSQRGFALIITLMVTTLLVALVTEFIREVYVETTLRRSYRDGEQALLMADSGIRGGQNCCSRSWRPRVTARSTTPGR